jgi:hypothetical protein
LLPAQRAVKAVAARLAERRRTFFQRSGGYGPASQLIIRQNRRKFLSCSSARSISPVTPSNWNFLQTFDNCLTIRGVQ